MGPPISLATAGIMNSGILKTLVLLAGVSLALGAFAVAQDNGPIRGNAGQASQPSGPGVPAPGTNAAPPPSTTPSAKQGTSNSPAPAPTTATSTQASDNAAESDTPRTVISNTSNDPNANDPLLEPPPLPKTKPTLIGGTAARIDHVRNLLTIQPFGGG
ncbi:MAG: hypothetical protein JOY71_15555, partial [Acetobacteraceae bacterium]|nr:hypothetical protein [Acetobacteraceae bacterium]